MAVTATTMLGGYALPLHPWREGTATEEDRSMPEQNEAERLARAWIEGWIAGKPDEIPLAREFTHSSPFGVVKGREKYL